MAKRKLTKEEKKKIAEREEQRRREKEGEVLNVERKIKISNYDYY